jgi:hypothetical protein
VTPRARTNQLLYQAELLLSMEAAAGREDGDETTDVRRQALHESVLAMLELTLESLLREVTGHAGLERHGWRELLGDVSLPCAELVRLRELAGQPQSWLAWLVARLEALHSSQGATGRQKETPAGLIAVEGSGSCLENELWSCVNGVRAEIAALRETSQEW